MATVAHPVFKDQTHYVSDDDLQSWVDQGWSEVTDNKQQLTQPLTSFEQALLDQEKREGEPAPETSVSFQPHLSNDDIPTEV